MRIDPSCIIFKDFSCSPPKVWDFKKYYVWENGEVLKSYNGNPELDNVCGCKTSPLGIRGWSNEDQNIRLSLASWFCCLFWFCLNRLKVHFESRVKLYGSFRAKWLLKKYVRVQSSWKSTLHKVHFLYHGPFYTCCNFVDFFCNLQTMLYLISGLDYHIFRLEKVTLNLIGQFSLFVGRNILYQIVIRSRFWTIKQPIMFFSLLWYFAWSQLFRWKDVHT